VDRPNRSGRALWVAAAAGLVVLGLVAAQLADNRRQTAPAGSEVLGDYCQDYLDPVADALDLLRANPNQANADEAHRLLGQALNQLDQNNPIAVDVSDLAEDHSRAEPSAESSDSLIDLASSLGQRVASMTQSSPRCNYQRLAPNRDRSTDPLGRPITDD